MGTHILQKPHKHGLLERCPLEAGLDALHEHGGRALRALGREARVHVAARLGVLRLSSNPGAAGDRRRRARRCSGGRVLLGVLRLLAGPTARLGRRLGRRRPHQLPPLEDEHAAEGERAHRVVSEDGGDEAGRAEARAALVRLPARDDVVAGRLRRGRRRLPREQDEQLAAARALAQQDRVAREGLVPAEPQQLVQLGIIEILEQRRAPHRRECLVVLKRARRERERHLARRRRQRRLCRKDLAAQIEHQLLGRDRPDTLLDEASTLLEAGGSLLQPRWMHGDIDGRTCDEARWQAITGWLNDRAG